MAGDGCDGVSLLGYSLQAARFLPFGQFFGDVIWVQMGLTVLFMNLLCLAVTPPQQQLGPLGICP